MESATLGGSGSSMPRFSRLSDVGLDEEASPGALPYGAEGHDPHHRARTRTDPSASSRWCSRWIICGGFVAVVICVIIISTSLGSDKATGAAKRQCFSPASSRLPPSVVPSNYRIWLSPDFEAPYEFKGYVSIDVDIDESIPDSVWQEGCIILNALEMEVDEVFVRPQSDPTEDGVSSLYSLHESDQRLIVTMPDSLMTSRSFTVDIKYHAPLNRNMEGLYLSLYKNDAGADVPMVATQFEATAARRAFPSFDEPAFKAKFKITVTNVPAGYVARSNMPALPAAPTQGSSPIPLSGQSVSFEETPIMSTYLVAVVMGKISAVSDTTANGVDVSVWAREGYEDLTKFALDTAVTVLETYESAEKGFGIAFPLPKLDLVAIPDFAAGAMENWGLVTFRETALLASETESSQSALQRVAVVVAHELAHQWFGNLVTMEWWQQLWLNEGFATFEEFLGTNASRPEFDIYQYFHEENPQVAMTVDGFGASHALAGRAVETSAQIEEMFDAISYSKGASIIWMVSRFIGADSFSTGIHNYLTAHQYGNAKTSDLWDALGAASGDPDLASKMEPFTQKAGVPLVTLSWNPEKTELIVSQKRFFRSAYSESKAKEPGTIWWIPLTLAGGNGTAATGVVAAANRATLDAGFYSEVWDTRITYSFAVDGWIKANINQAGYYRVNYPIDVWQTLGDALLNPGSSPRALSIADRAGLVNDAFAIAFSSPVGDMSMVEALKLSAFLKNERDYAVWSTAADYLGSLYAAVIDDSANPEFECADNLGVWANHLMEGVIAELGWDPQPDEIPLISSLRNVVLSHSSFFGRNETIVKAKQLWDNAAGDLSKIHPDIQSVVFSSVVRWGDSADFESVKLAYENATLPATKRSLLLALSASRRADLLNAALDYSLSANVRPQDTVSLIVRVARNPLGKNPAWNFLKAKWDVLNSRYGSGGFAISNLILNVASPFSSFEKLSEVTAFFISHEASAAAIEVAEAEESIGGRAQWVTQAKSATCSFLAAAVAA